MAAPKKHTVSKCYACSMQFTEIQRSFPLKPFFEASIVNPQLCSSKNAKFEAKVVLKELNGVFEVKHSKSFTDILPKVCNLKAITQPQLKQDFKRPYKTALIRDCEKRMSENIAITHLAECESDASYVRKRKMTSFTAVSSEPKKSRLCQIPSDKELEIISFLQNYCEDKPIVWSAVAKQFNITTTNGGYMVKQLAIRSGLNVESLQCKKDKDSPRNRVHKKRTSDSKVPVPCMPSLAKLKQEVGNLIDNGTLYLGEPCAPYSIYRYKWVDGNLDKCEYQVYGRKMNFDYLRHKLFEKHEPYMRLTSEDVISKLSSKELSQRVSKFEPIETNDRQYLMKRLKQLERTRHLSLWHDHSAVLSRGYILVTLSVIFDEAVFDVSLYDERKHGVKLQEYVEQPEIYMICMSSSSVDDQAAIIPDRLECLSSLSQPLISSNGVEVNDVLRFFVGDHKATAFEQGAQCGGNFPCGTSGIHVSKFTDQTHALRRRVRSLQDIQNLATSGRFGKRFNVVRPFESLTMGDIQTELRLRGCIDVDMPKAQLIAKLKNILEGVQRVPSLLLSCPTSELKQFNLTKYSILPCEPLHDLKGHLNNLLPNVPTLLTGELKTNVHDVIQKCVYWKDSGHTGADMRVGLLRVYSMLIKAVESGIFLGAAAGSPYIVFISTSGM